MWCSNCMHRHSDNVISNGPRVHANWNCQDCSKCKPKPPQLIKPTDSKLLQYSCEFFSQITFHWPMMTIVEYNDWNQVLWCSNWHNICLDWLHLSEVSAVCVSHIKANIHVHACTYFGHNTECKPNAERWNLSTCGMSTVSYQVYEANGESRLLWPKSWTLLCQPQGKTVVDSYILLLAWHGCSQCLHFVPVSSSRKSDDNVDVSRCSFPRNGVRTIVSAPQILIGGLVVCEVSSLWQKRMKMMGVPDNITLQQGNHFPIQTSTFRHFCLCSSRTNNKRSEISAMSHSVLRHTLEFFTSVDCKLANVESQQLTSDCTNGVMFMVHL